MLDKSTWIFSLSMLPEFFKLLRHKNHEYRMAKILEKECVAQSGLNLDDLYTHIFGSFYISVYSDTSTLSTSCNL